MEGLWGIRRLGEKGEGVYLTFAVGRGLKLRRYQEVKGEEKRGRG